MKKYELTDQTIAADGGTTLHRIRALRDFRGVKAGDLGGYIQTEENLAHEDNCWVYDDAQVYGNARVYRNVRLYINAQVFDNAQVCDNARVYGNALVCGDTWVFGEAKLDRVPQQDVWYT